MKTKLPTKAGKRDLHKLQLNALMFNPAAPMNREQRRQVAKSNRKVAGGGTVHNVELRGAEPAFSAERPSQAPGSAAG